MLKGDARVRANVIESAAPAVAEELQPLFRTAALDSNNRVAGNALVALYRMGEASAVAGLYEMACRQDPAFRATAVWAMSETGDTRFLPLLGRMLKDSSENIKSAAFRAIRTLRAQETGQVQALEVRILGKPSFEGSTLKVAFGVSDGCKKVTGISATQIRILAAGESVYRYTVREQEYNRRISAAFLVPRIANQIRERSVAYRNALEECFEERRMGDGWFLSQYSNCPANQGPARTETLFGVRLDSAEMAKIHLVGNPGELRNALETGASLESKPPFWDCARNFVHREEARICFCSSRGCSAG